ncbi:MULTISPECIES: DNA-processing protein DprA [unclassified Cryobacterium]|uniref:DNA-processing protein DprA n=1 Tax=unclassified Cryobacterium TaxID=2649013 RepID=UPI000CE4F4EE|nr:MULTISPECIES: DNA-processing protein DprA [unclassified Cryobacterium]
MMLFGLEESTVVALTGGVRASAGSGPTDAAAAADVFARAAWTGISEPGDGAAGLLVQGLGAGPALSAVLDLWTGARLAGALAATGLPLTDDLQALLEQALQRWRPRLSSAEVIRSLQQAARASAGLLVPTDAHWPRGVDDLAVHAPIALWWRGIPTALTALSNSIALVGARAATGYGEHVTMEASAGLVDRGFLIVSGAAYGIDGMAHRAALASSGLTVAFLAGGVDRYYPSGHDALLSRIATMGAIISELPCGAAPTKWRFLQRNRLIAAASAATVVLEAGWRSGSLNTAGHAAALGRPLGAVPGPVTSPTSAGCHRLIREYDAVCVSTAAEMAELVGERMLSLTLDLPPADGDTAGFGGRTSEQVRVFDALSTRAARSVTDIARRAGLSMSTVQGSLGALDLEGVVREKETGWVRGR